MKRLARRRSRLFGTKSAGMAVYLMLNEMPRFAAITLVAPTVRFRALAILLAPFLSFAIVFNVR
jgi:hypothetical protein